mgnify:CR=1 FL=1
MLSVTQYNIHAQFCFRKFFSAKKLCLTKFIRHTILSAKGQIVVKKVSSGNRKKVFCKASGQVLVEYVIMLTMLLLIAVGVLGLSYYFNLFGERMTDSVSIEYP